MIKKILAWFGYVPKIHKEQVQETPKENDNFYRKRPLHFADDMMQTQRLNLEQLWEHNFKNAVHPSIAMDSAKGQSTFALDNSLNLKQPYYGVVPEAQITWYASQSFIGYQLCSMLAQQWLISKACLMPAKDATRNGYELTVNDGTDIDPEILDAIRNKDIDYKISANLIEFIQMGRIFGIRVALFVVESDDPEYYRNPFNADGVTPGSYRGISQIDPYWITPQLDTESSGNPAAIDFYEPTWWIINGHPVHRTHLVIFRTEEVSDILKPTYIFGGVPIPQKIAQRVFAAETCANEAPQILLTKRTDVIKADLAQGVSQWPSFVERIQQWVTNRDNFGVKMLGLEEDMQQFDTGLSDMDAVIMTQYQLVAAACNVPATKLMGTQPKGFNSTGEFEEASYHEELESIQKHDLTALLDRHHLLLIRSEIIPEFNCEEFNVVISWNRLDSMTEKEQSEINKMKAENGIMLQQSGAIDAEEERQRVMNDPKSGYTGLADKPENDDLLEQSENTGEEFDPA